MAQLVARLVRNEKVRGSNPLISTWFFRFTLAVNWKNHMKYSGFEPERVRP